MNFRSVLDVIAHTAALQKGIDHRPPCHLLLCQRQHQQDHRNSGDEYR